MTVLYEATTESSRGESTRVQRCCMLPARIVSGRDDSVPMRNSSSVSGVRLQGPVVVPDVSRSPARPGPVAALDGTATLWPIRPVWSRRTGSDEGGREGQDSRFQDFRFQT